MPNTLHHSANNRDICTNHPGIIPLGAAPEAFFLSLVAGWIDAVGFLYFSGLFVAHMSGNSAALGAFLGAGEWKQALPHLFAIPVFILGLVAGYWMMRTGRSYQRCAVVFVVEATLLAVFALSMEWIHAPTIASSAYYLIALTPLLAMGLQNATLRQLGRSGFPSTYVTGILDTFGRAIAGILTTRSSSLEHSIEWRNARTSGTLWVCYAAGAISGSIGIVRAGPSILILPLGLLIVIAVIFWFRENEPKNKN